MRIVAAVFALSMAMFGQAKPGEDEINWLDNYQAALKEARATGKPIFLEYRCEP